MTDLTHILGKRFKPGGRGPRYYDCVGVAAVVVRAILGNKAAESLPGGVRTRISTDEDIPSGWKYVGKDVLMAEPGHVILTQRKSASGHVEHHVYAVTDDRKLASSEHNKGVIMLPKRGISGEVVGIYEWQGEA